MARMMDKVALVVGGAKGIGLAVAERLAIEGASVVLTGRRAEEVEAAAARIGRPAATRSGCVGPPRPFSRRACRSR